MSFDYRPFQKVAESAAREAGALLREAYGRVAAREKRPGDLVTDADFASQRLIADRILHAFPDHTLLAEEEGGEPDLACPWRWVVDPLDGTINFAHGFPFWAVSIALEHAGTLVVGVVYNPLSGEMYSASEGQGATCDGRPLRVSGAERLSDCLIATAIPVDFPESADIQMAYFRRFSIGTHSVRRTGSSALNLALLAAGGFDVCYATFMNPWDAAAGVVLVREAGGSVTNLSGAPYDLYGDEILASNSRVHDESLAALEEARRDPRGKDRAVDLAGRARRIVAGRFPACYSWMSCLGRALRRGGSIHPSGARPTNAPSRLLRGAVALISSKRSSDLLRSSALWVSRVLVVTVVLCLGAAAAGEEPLAAPEASGDIKIFLNTPANLEELWKKLAQPDFILMRGGARKEGDNPRTGVPSVEPPAAVVDSVNVQGGVEKDLAKLAVEFGITNAGDTAAWVPIRLDEAVLIGVREGDRMLDVRDVKDKGWQVELRGKGPHQVRVDLRTRLKAAGDGYRLELAIPDAAKTQFQLDIPQRVVDASAGPSEPLEPLALAQGQRTRLAAHLTARARLEVSWRVEAEPGIQLPHLLAMQGEIAIDIDPESLRTKSSWMIHAVRGTTRNLELRLDPNVEVLDVELDGQTPPAGSERVEGGTKLTINLVEPLRPGEPKKLTMTTRLALTAQALPRVMFSGFSLANAKDQSGALCIAQSGNVYVQGVAGRGVRQFDPRDLPEKLRVRPATVLAYQFVDQPFELSLSVEPSPPLVRTESRTTVGLSARGALIETWLDYKIARGRLYEARVSLPRGLELDLTGPEDIVESSKLEADATEGAGARVLTVLLKQRARNAGTFSLRLAGRQTIDPAKPVALALFRPLDSTASGGRIAVVADRDLTIEGSEPSEGGEDVPESFRLAMGEPPADWPWPSDRAGSGADEPPTLWLRHDDHPAVLPLRITVHPRTITHESNLLVRVERRWIEVRQEIVCNVRFGTMEQLNVSVPREIQGRWEIEEGNVAGRKDLGTSATGDQVTRLNFAQPVSDRTRLKLQLPPAVVAGPRAGPTQGDRHPLGTGARGDGRARAGDDRCGAGPRAAAGPLGLDARSGRRTVEQLRGWARFPVCPRCAGPGDRGRSPADRGDGAPPDHSAAAGDRAALAPDGPRPGPGVARHGVLLGRDAPRVAPRAAPPGRGGLPGQDRRRGPEPGRSVANRGLPAPVPRPLGIPSGARGAGVLGPCPLRGVELGPAAPARERPGRGDALGNTAPLQPSLDRRTGGLDR